MAEIIDGKKISAQIRGSIKEETARFIAETGVTPGLAVILVGSDPASQIYVRNKKKACEEVGFKSFEYLMPESTTEEELKELVNKLNHTSEVHGILCQLPLPKHISEKAVIESISPMKDVDAFHPANVGRIMTGDYNFLPCTPAGIMELIKSTGVEIAGKKCVVVGRSNIVGKPMAMLLLHANGTVTMCHSKTADLKKECLEADILVVATGKAKMIKADMVKPGAVVIDVGMDRDENGKLCGDVDFDEVSKVAGYITPVPGGVGPMTIAMLMRNTYTAAKIAASR
ncbi:MAG TPA: bifunctional methylenetetrahydrofolate dehydrogenase/methenyltetrahydrofolate cyclohydrolase FolD [Candidatus Faeciplasma pullistercoris]|uniref:Bifunctional protein FolD n=1 Tax=Candidatus Faeciplasma pullistercoris TaxID=2840800 RepID=A0A9D1GTS9_9FIRM|nr:bifunctional methylenetetrahydrofolate dehydrogenase/methenyltetrahydrofolate cyclohydrolase FolD [Candidatus Faeciplasma pullistercoris]